MSQYSILQIAIAYLIGSLPIGLVIGKLVRGIDLREYGSGNIGASNAWRILGPAWGTLVFLLDVSKGLGPVLFTQPFHHSHSSFPILVGLASILGHNFSPFLGFKGGKGVATSLGVAIGFSWAAGLIGLGAWGVSLVVTRYISVSSIVGTLVGSALIWQYHGHALGYGIFGLLASAFVVARHRENIQRLKAGTERRVSFRKKAME